MKPLELPRNRGLVKAVVLAGGLGTRLKPYTLFLPKPMLPLGNKPVLEHQLEWLRKHGVKDVTIAVGYMKRIIEDHFGDGKEFGLKINYARSNRPLGTAGQLKSAEEYVSTTFLCLYCDSLLDFDLKDAVAFHQSERALVTMILMKYATNLRYGFINLDDTSAVTSWREKPKITGLINIGYYIMEPRFLEYIPKGKMFGMDNAVRTALKKNERIVGYVAKGDFIDIGDKKSYRLAYEQYLNKLGEIL